MDGVAGVLKHESLLNFEKARNQIFGRHRNFYKALASAIAVAFIQANGLVTISRSIKASILVRD